MTVQEELELLAKDCEYVAKEAIALQGGSTISTAEQRTWMSVAARIRHVIKRLNG
jgi:hypothetical protein